MPIETDPRVLALRALEDAIAVLEDAIAEKDGDAGEAGTMWDPVAGWVALRFHGRTLAGPWLEDRDEEDGAVAYERMAAHPSYHSEEASVIARAVCRVDRVRGWWRAVVGDVRGSQWRATLSYRWETPEAAAFAVDKLLRAEGAILASGGALVPVEADPIPPIVWRKLDDTVHPTADGYSDLVDALVYATAPIGQSNAQGIGPDPDPRPVLDRGPVVGWVVENNPGGTDEAP